MACSDCPNFLDPSFVCVTVERPAGTVFYGINRVSFVEMGAQTFVTYQVCNCNPEGTMASGVSFVSFELCPDMLNLEATQDANPNDEVEIRDPADGEFNFDAVKISFGTSIEPEECRNVVLVYDATGVTEDDFGEGNVGVKIGGGPFGPNTAAASFGLLLLGCPTNGDECPNDCNLVVCGETNVPFDCPIDVCPEFTLVPNSAQAAICSGEIECEELSCQQEVEVTLCGQTFTCCVEIPLRRYFGTLTIATSAQFEDPCGNQVALCCEQEVPVDVICPFCPGEAPPCDPLPPLCQLFAVSVGQPSQQNPGDDVIINGVVISRCNCAESTETFTNDDGITIPAEGSSGPADPYPSTIDVSGLTGAISNVTVTLNGFTHTFPADVDVMLVAPDGTTNTILMTDPDLGTDVTNLDLTFDDAAANQVPCNSPLTSGTYRPTSCGSPNFTSPAPAPNPIVALSNFDGIDPNGTWSLYVFDDAGLDVGSIASWSITITTTCP